MSNKPGEDFDGSGTKTSDSNYIKLQQSQVIRNTLHDISTLLNTGLNAESLDICIKLIEAGVHPQSLAAVVHEIRKEVQQFQQSEAICLLLAQQYMRLGNLKQAEVYYVECLKWTPKDLKILLCLAQLYMHLNAMEQCSNICHELLSLEPTNQHATVMLADIWFRKMDFLKAAQNFSKLLCNQPTHWTVLVRLIQTLRRLGQLPDCLPFIKRAETFNAGNGLIYCKGLYNWYDGHLDKALQDFNKVRRDIEWGQQATSNMIEIYLNQDEDIIYDFNNDNYIFNTKKEKTEDDLTRLSTAKVLLKQLQNAAPQQPFEVYNIKLLENLLLLASNEQDAIDLAMENLNQMLECTDNAHKVGLVFGLVLAYLKLDNLMEAKQQIKSILHVSWSFEESIHLERCYLYMSFIYMQQNKPDAAMHFLKRILELDKSCVGAYELAGFISESCELYDDAANYYNEAWKLCYLHKPYVAYKLVCCLLKLKRYADAANISQQVLKYHPEFALIQNEVLNECRQYLRN